ncbi:MAG: hypothetical protein KC550_02605 [Nanoarchaeota archaeon]|nr:hypothetical protein [Nanoarchaeota archaeon]
MRNPKVSLIRVEEGSWKNFFIEKAVYGLSSIEEAERFSTFSTFDVVKRDELIVRKKRGNLLVDLMSRYKTPVWRGETGLTLESSYLVPLN